MDITQSWAHQIITAVHSFYKEQQLCDFTITTNYQHRIQSIECHRTVLAAASTYFAEKLLHNGRNADINFIEVANEKPETVKEALNFLYTGKCRITKHNVTGLLELGSAWCVDKLVKECLRFFSDTGVNIENCVQYHEACIRSKTDENTKQAVAHFIKEHFRELHQANTLSQLSVAGFTDILSTGKIGLMDENVSIDELNNENVVFDAVVKWTEANPLLSVNALLPLIRYEQMTDDYLLDTVLLHQVMSAEERDRIKALIKLRLKSGRQTSQIDSATAMTDVDLQATLASAPKPNPEEPDLQRDRLLKITSAHQLCSYSANGKKWKVIMKVPGWVCARNSTCVYGSQVLFTGIVLEDSRSCPVDFRTCAYLADIDDASKSRALPDLPIGSRHAKLAHTGKEIFATGCKYPDLNEMYSINLQEQPLQWKKCTPMLYAVYCHQSWYYKGHIYVVGGCTPPMDDYTGRAQKYNIATAAWGRCADCPVEFINTYLNRGLQIKNEMVFFLAKERVTYNCDTDRWSVQQYRTGQRDNCSTPVWYDGEIVVVTSQDHNGKPVVRKYNERRRTWKNVDIDIGDCMHVALIF